LFVDVRKDAGRSPGTATTNGAVLWNHESIEKTVLGVPGAEVAGVERLEEI
jgi:hypothetical protein